MLLPNAAAEAQSSPTTATATATATPTDYDSDDDGLIDIKTLAQLNAVRYDLNGDGKQGTVSAADWAIYTAAFPNPEAGMGCKTTGTPPQPDCDGYELMPDDEDDLDFDTNGDGEVNSSDTYPNWTPIGTTADKFTAAFKGSLTNDVMPKISNLTITSISGGGVSKEVALFGATSATARIEDVGLVNVKIDITTSSDYVNIGALVGSNAGKVIACYSTGAIDASAGLESYAGGLVGSNTGTIDASFSRATVSMSKATSATGVSANVYAGGLAGHNTGTLTATYAAGAVKGMGGGGYVGGLVGFNTVPTDATSGTKTIIASYSIAPVTAVGMTVAATATPTVGGMTGCCADSATTATVTASYWDFISSGIDDDSGDAMPEGKSTHDLISPKSFDTGIYIDWNDLTIDDANDVHPWVIDSTRFHPMLTYGGHTTDISGNQLFVNSGIDSPYPRNTVHPHEGMTLYSNMGSYGDAFKGKRKGSWIWETSTDGITWSHPVFSSPCAVTHSYSCGPEYPAYRGAGGTYRFVPRAEHEDKYIRAKAPLNPNEDAYSHTDGYAYTRVIGKIKLASADAPLAMSFASGNNRPRVGTAITVASPTTLTVVGLWQRCDDKGSNGSSPSGCDYVGSLPEYTPGVDDLNHFLRAYIYYKDDGRWKRTSIDFTTKQVENRVGQWR